MKFKQNKGNRVLKYLVLNKYKKNPIISYIYENQLFKTLKKDFLLVDKSLRFCVVRVRNLNKINPITKLRNID